MTIYDLKPKFQALLRPIVKNLASKGYTANQVTIWAMLLSFVGGIFVLLGLVNKYFLLFIPFVMFIRMALNAIDGMLAKEHDMKTKTGAMLNEITDVVSDAVLYLPFAFLINPIIVVLFVVISIFTEFIGISAQAVYNDRRYDGPMGKSDRAFVIGLISLLFAIGINFTILNIIVTIAIVLAFLTMINRWKKVNI
ncbi:CDP-alcohol phosphatidyltransferase family protein [Arcobacter sp. LA11]|uniref:CDP-alcohol phosphatidyltransferase family protein n=1 Tax=Arcobacter sp. LA11 TaxID=1898176 RepID=UPI000932BB11|nr:CDP-alcohol phosphatidyltransferase family protein [Arcobacter sp. LA11]